MNNTKITPTIINSKPAERHLETIRTQHAGLVEGLNNHLLRVQQYNMNKDMEAQNQAMQNADMQQRQAEFTQKGEAQKAVSDKAEKDFQIKQQEIALKMAALNQPE